MQKQAQLDREGCPLGIVQETELSPYYQMLYTILRFAYTNTHVYIYKYIQ